MNLVAASHNVVFYMACSKDGLTTAGTGRSFPYIMMAALNIGPEGAVELASITASSSGGGGAVF